MPISNTLQAIHVIETHGISALSIHATGEGVEIEVADLDPLITPTTAVRPHHGGRAIAVDGVDIVDSDAEEEIAAAHTELAELRRLLHQLVVIACGAQDIGQTPEARRDIVAKAAARISEDRAAIEEMRLTLAAEQGRQEGAPDPAWSRKMMNGESYWEKWYPAGDVAIVRLDGSFSRGHFDGKTTARHGKADNQRAAMLAADKATP